MLSPILGDAYGQERVMRDSTRLLREAGHEVFFLAGETRGQLPESNGFAIVENLAKLDWRFPRARAGETRQTAFAHLARFNPDVVHLVDQFDANFQRQLCARFSVMMTAHLIAATCPQSQRLIGESGICTETSGWKCVLNNYRFGCLRYLKSDFHRLEALHGYLKKRRSLRGLKVMGAVSHYVESALIRDGWPQEKGRCIPNPVDVAMLPTRLSGAPKNLISCLSRLETYKGVDLLIRALKLLEKLEWTLWVAGDGTQRKNLENLTGDLRLANRIRFLGNQPYEMARQIMVSSRIVVAPNRGAEPFGLSLAEAAGLGTAVVCSDVPAFNEIVEPEVTGLTFKVGDPGTLAKQLSRLLIDDKIGLKLGTAARKFIGEAYHPQRHLKATLQAYAQCRSIPASPNLSAFEKLET